MPKQETFFEKSIGDGRVEVLKSYDQGYAREVFANMDGAALKHLWDALAPENAYEPDGLPGLGSADGEAEAFLWDELVERAREDGNTCSFFVVVESTGRRSEALYVGPDWPSAESYANARLANQKDHC